jgi:hypothetical protein
MVPRRANYLFHAHHPNSIAEGRTIRCIPVLQQIAAMSSSSRQARLRTRNESSETRVGKNRDHAPNGMAAAYTSPGGSQRFRVLSTDRSPATSRSSLKTVASA